jgi:SAM-dependent methyltransferase
MNKDFIESIKKAVIENIDDDCLNGLRMTLTLDINLSSQIVKEETNFCPICGKDGVFKPFGIKPRPRAQCPNCRSVERHRELWLYLKQKTDWFTKPDLSFLHIAAEACFLNVFKQTFKNYITADLLNPNAMVKMDIQDIQYPAESFDIIMCNHVLEHVPDDIKAMQEFFRVLKKGGEAILLVPIFPLEKIYEDAAITTPEGRLEAFGQGDHLRKYGHDYPDRLRSVGFIVKETHAREFLSENETKRMGITNEAIYHCIKPSG